MFAFMTALETYGPAVLNFANQAIPLVVNAFKGGTLSSDFGKIAGALSVIVTEASTLTEVHQAIAAGNTPGGDVLPNHK